MDMTREDVAAIAKEIAQQILQEQAPVTNVTYDDMVRAMGVINQQRPIPANPADKGLGMAKFLRAMAAGKADPERAARWAAKTWGGEDHMTKILEASEDSGGGVLVPTQHSTEVIELLRERAVFRSMRPTTVPMPTGSMQIPKLTGGATATYIGESQNIVKTEQTTGMVNLSWKKLAAVVPISNDFLRFETYGADTMIRNDLVASMADREDIAFIRGDGTENTPKGLKSFVPTANIINSNGTVTIASITSEVMQAMLKLRNAHVRMINVGWLWSPRTTLYLKSLRDTNNNFVFKTELDAGTFFGFPYADTTNIPDTLGGGTESEVYLVDFADIVLGESMNLMIDTSSEASYWDGSALQSAYSKDLTLMRVIAEHDLGCRHVESIVLIDTVKWTW